jgi:hypothetical protein
MKKTFFHVVRVNGDPSDTFAHENLQAAIEMAQADPGDYLESATVYASDPGAARVEANNRGTQWRAL